MAALKNELAGDPRVRALLPDGTNADELRDIPAAEQQRIHVMEVYRALDPTSPDAVLATLLEANVLRRYGQFDRAIPLYRDIVDHHRDDDAAEPAANLLLDSYNRTQQYAALLAVAEELRADNKFLATKPDLAQILEKLHAQGVRLAAEQTERTARAGHDLALFDRCGEQFLAIDGDEALYNAIVCFHEAGSTERALAAAGQLATISELAPPRQGPRAHGRDRCADRPLRGRGARRRGLRGAVRRRARRGRHRDRRLAYWRHPRFGQLDRAARDVDLVATAAAARGDDDVRRADPRAARRRAARRGRPPAAVAIDRPIDEARADPGSRAPRRRSGVSGRARRRAVPEAARPGARGRGARRPARKIQGDDIDEARRVELDLPSISTVTRDRSPTSWPAIASSA